jgi:bifunctional enzyme CysN/CysC
MDELAGGPALEPDETAQVDLLRFTTAGSVDDGKSTLIGRLLYDTKNIFDDQLEAVERASRHRGEGYVNLALLTDGLRAEREQNITIDVAYRYFSTPKRKFIIADTPGHEQYTRNMVTGASSAELAIILVDARKGVQTQSRRHGFIASLLGIPHLVVAVNKMDLVGFAEDVFERVRQEFSDFAARLATDDVTFIPVSALLGDNVVGRSSSMPWYDGPSLLHHLETVRVGSSRNLVDFRFPVQLVVRPGADFRGYAGRVASGTVTAGQEVVALPSGARSRVRTLATMDGPLDEAVAGQSIVVTLEDEIDLSRGEMIVRANNLPHVADSFDATLCWMAEAPLDLTRGYVLLHTTRQARAFVSRLHYRIDIRTLHRESADTLGLNDIGRVEITAGEMLFFDPYDRNRETGGFILVDPHSNATVAAGMIRGVVRTADSVFDGERQERLHSQAVVWDEWNMPRERREERNSPPAMVIWLTGLSGSGKTTIARALEQRLWDSGVRTVLLDGDQLRRGLCADLGFSAEDRTENIRRAGEVARLFFEAGHVVLCTFVSPFRNDREHVRGLLPEDRFLEAYVDTPLEVCRRRDPKGLYARADAGEIPDFTGISSPYEVPEDPEVVIRTEEMDVEAAVRLLLGELHARGLNVSTRST